MCCVFCVVPFEYCVVGCGVCGVCVALLCVLLLLVVGCLSRFDVWLLIVAWCLVFVVY